MFMRLLRADPAATGEPGSPISFVAATPGKKRDGYDTAALPWRTDRYAQNPVVTWVHDFGGNRLPIGRGVATVEKTPAGEVIRAELLFDIADPFAAEIDRKYRAGFLNAVSVSWDDVDEDGVPVRNSGKKAVAHDLLEIAAVPVPGDPGALQERQATALRALRDDLDAVLGAGSDDDPAPAGAATGRAAADGDAERAVGGSYEDLSNRVAEAIRATGIFSGYVYVHATFADNVVIGVWREDDYTCRLYRVNYTDTGSEVTIGDWVPVRMVEAVEELGSAAVRLAIDTDDPWVSAATAMVDLMAPDAGGTDRQRKRGYVALQAAYRRAGRTPPELLPADDLAALDDANWRALFVSGELAIVAAVEADQARAGAELSARNFAEFSGGADDIEAGLKRIRGVLERVSATKDQGSAEADDGERATEPTEAELLDELHAAFVRQER